jgi:hypothetical protein
MSTRTYTTTFERGTETIATSYSVDSDLAFDVGTLTVPTGSSLRVAQALDVSAVTDIFIANTQAMKLRINGTNEVQRITPTGTISGGTTTFTYSGQTTGAVAYNATAADVQAALEALSNIAAGDVLCTGGPLNVAPIDIEYRKALGCANVAEITHTPSLTGGGSLAMSTVTAGVASALDIDLEAGVGLLWHEAMAGIPNPFSVDWTAFVVDNDSGADGTIAIRGGTDL